MYLNTYTKWPQVTEDNLLKKEKVIEDNTNKDK